MSPQLIGGRCRKVSVQHVAVNIRLLVTLVQEGAGKYKLNVLQLIVGLHSLCLKNCTDVSVQHIAVNEVYSMIKEGAEKS